MSKRPVTVIRESRNPFEIWLMGAAVLGGVFGLLPHEARGLIDQLAAHWAIAWHIGLIVGGGAALAGILLLRYPLSLLVERIGNTLLATLMTSYGIGVYVLLGWDQVRTGGLLTLMFGAACAARAVQLSRLLARLESEAD